MTNSVPWRKPRDVLPLPLLTVESPPDARLSRDVRRRAVRRQCWLGWANEGIAVLNGLGHEGQPAVLPPPVASAAQAQCLSAVARAYSGLPLDVDDRVFGAGALQALCSRSSCYTGDRSDIEPYLPSRVSWPPDDFKPVGLEALLGQDDLSWWGSWRSHLLRPTSEAEAILKEKDIRPYVDPVFKQYPAEYAGFLRGLHSRGVVRFVEPTQAVAKL